MGLYNTIFTNPQTDLHERADIRNWRSAYDPLRELAEISLNGEERPSDLRTIATILLRNPEDLYLAWMMSCFVPWARAKLPGPTSKRPTTLATLAAREGIKADNKLAKIITHAVLELENVIKMKDSVVSQAMSSNSPLNEKDRAPSRENQGQAIRRWGQNWRSIAIYALLVQLSEAKEIGKSSINPYRYALRLSSKYL